MFSRAVLAVASVMFAIPAVAQSKPLMCKWTEKQQCDPKIGCRTIGITTYAKIDLAGRRYERCDKRGCDTYVANVSGGVGKFTNVDVTGSGMFLKIGPEGNSTEVVSLGNMVLISQGICR